VNKLDDDRRRSRNGWWRFAAILLLFLLARPAPGAEVVTPREPFFGMEKVQLRIEYKEITLVAARIHGMFSRQGWYRIEPGQSLIELCDTAERLDAIQALLERLDSVPRNFTFEVSLMNYAGGEAQSPSPDTGDRREEAKLSVLNQRMALKKQVNREEMLGRKSLVVREGQFIEFPLGQGYNIEFHVGYFDRTKELIEINRLVFSRRQGRAADSAGQQGTVILSTDLRLGNGVKHLLTMRKPGCQEYFSLAIRASLRDEPVPRQETARDDGDLPVREWP
jgi:hypothetical protein